MIVLTTTEDKIRTLAARWESQWKAANGEWKRFRGQPYYEQAHAEMLKLPENATREDVARIMGKNTGWIDIHCDECSLIVDKAISFVYGPVGEGMSVVLCYDCLELAGKVFMGRVKKYVGK